MYGESPDITGGIGGEGVDAVARFLEAGGTVIAMGNAVRFPTELGLARTVDASAATSAQFYAPRPLVNAEILRLDHPVFYGYNERIMPIKYLGGPLMSVGPPDQGAVLARYVGGDDAVLSGLMRGASEIRQRPFAVDVPGGFNGKGRVLLFANNPIYRWQNHGEFNMVFNSVLNWNDMPKSAATGAAPTAAGSGGFVARVVSIRGELWMTEDNPLADRGRALEEDYFRKKDRELIEKMRAADAAAKARKELGASTGLSDPALLDELQQLGFTPDTVPLLPLIPLVRVAWAEGGVSAQERKMILDLARARGIAAGSAADRQLAEWLDRQPSESVFARAMRLISAVMSGQSTNASSLSADDLVKYCEEIAAASGGLLGIGKVSSEERKLLASIAAELKAGR